MRWILGIFAALGILVLFGGLAVVLGWVDVGRMDPFKDLNAAASHATTSPTVDEQDHTAEIEASLADMKHPGYVDRVIFLSANEAKLTGPKVGLELRAGGGYYYSRRGNSTTVDPKNRLPNSVIRGWTSPDDSAEWAINCPKAGNYMVTFDCYPGVSGERGVASGKFTISAGNERLEADVRADVSGRYGGSSFHVVQVGTIKLPAGQVTLKITPAESDRGLLSLRSVRIYPAE